MQHAIAALFHGEWVTAAIANPTVYVGPVLIAGALVAQRTGNRVALNFTVAISVAYMVALTMLRNL
ncbi:MAG: hypothetical protein RLZZ319_714 [Actinomycetota bacterium]|jgi:hypothetical protein